MRLFSLAVLLLVCRVGLAEGTNQINGAFGLKLGDVFDPATALSKTNAQEVNNIFVFGEPMYQFAPQHPFAPLASYYVIITPKTHRIFGIYSFGKSTDETMAKKQQEAISVIVKNKYYRTHHNNIEAGSVWGVINDALDYNQETRGISVWTTIGPQTSRVNLFYSDSPLWIQSESERSELDMENRDISGI